MRYHDGDGFLILFTDEATGDIFVGNDDGLVPIDPDELEADENRITGYAGERTLNLAEKQDNQDALHAIVVPTDDGFLQFQGFNRASEVISRYQYDEDDDTMTDLQTGTVYRPVEGTFTAEDGSTIDPGWVTPIGFDNYWRLFTEPRIRDPFIRSFVWTFAFASLSVLSTFALGLLLALVFPERTDEVPTHVPGAADHPLRAADVHDHSRLARDDERDVRHPERDPAVADPLAQQPQLGALLSVAREPLARLRLHVPGSRPVR